MNIDERYCVTQTRVWRLGGWSRTWTGTEGFSYKVNRSIDDTSLL